MLNTITIDERLGSEGYMAQCTPDYSYITDARYIIMIIAS